MGDILSRCRIKKTGNPEVLTVNGKPEYVILDAASYQAIANELERGRFIRTVNEGIEDMWSRGGQSPGAAFAEIRESLAL